MNNSLRIAGLLSIVLLAACGPDKPPASAPTPKVSAVQVAVQADSAAAVGSSAPSADAAPFPVVAPAAPFKQLEREPAQTPVHELAPNVPVVPVVASGSRSGSAKTQTVVKASPGTKGTKTFSDPADIKNRAPIASKSKPAKQVVQQTHLAKPSLDLSLPSDMVDQLQPAGKVAPIVHTGVLPQMFSEKKSGKDTPFQLNGRLLSNEMQLQRRDEDRHSVEGAALDFEFKQ